jgi:hypothetical protein
MVDRALTQLLHHVIQRVPARGMPEHQPVLVTRPREWPSAAGKRTTTTSPFSALGYQAPARHATVCRHSAGWLHT